MTSISDTCFQEKSGIMGGAWKGHDHTFNQQINQQKDRKRITCFAILVFVAFFGAVHQVSHMEIRRPISEYWDHLLFNAGVLKDFPLSKLEAILQNEPDSSKAADWSYYYTSKSHFAGQGKEQALWTKQKWDGFGIPNSWIVKYNASVGRPLLQELLLLNSSDDSVLYKAKLRDELPSNDFTRVRAPAYHGNSASGNVTGQFVYANFGLESDYDELEAHKIDLRGKIAVLKNGIQHRAKKWQFAATRGLVGLVMYTDPQQDGNITEEHGYRAYPDGPARPETCIEIGNVGGEAPAEGSNPSIPGERIPSLPVSYSDIIPILRSLQGYGPKAFEMSSNWHGGGLYYKGVDYSVGPSPPQTVLNLNNQMHYLTQDIYQVFGKIEGTIKDEIIVIGNHRDSWTAGAGDSVSGATALVEVVRSFATAYIAGWRPRRTLIFASWEGEEIGQVGSRPWIAENFSWLFKDAVAYLNVVVAAAGADFQAKATPLLQTVIQRATKLVISPGGGSVFDQWGGEISSAGGGDAIPFLQNGIATLDLSFGSKYWPYHSNFDTFHWMNTTGDPGWKYHVTTAKIWSLIAAYLSESAVIDMRATHYAVALSKYTEMAKTKIPDSEIFDLSHLEDAVAHLHTASVRFDAYSSSLDVKKDDEAIRRVNKVYMSLERQFSYEGDHLVYPPSPFYLNGGEFPKLVQNLESGNMEGACEWMEILRGRIEDVATILGS